MDEYPDGVIEGVLRLLKEAKSKLDRYPGVPLSSVAEWLSPAGFGSLKSSEEGHRLFEAMLLDLFEAAKFGAIIFAGVADPVEAGSPDYLSIPWFRLRQLSFDANGSGWPSEEGKPAQYRHVRVFLPDEYGFVRACDGRLEPMPPTLGPAASLPQVGQRDRGGVEAAYKWDEFRKELVRALFAGELIDRRSIRAHMKAWCDATWEKSPSDTAIRDVLNPLLHNSIPDQVKTK